MRQGDELLDDDSFADTWRFQGRAGQQLEVTLRSAAFDAYLVVGRLKNGTFSTIESDDDGAGDTDSKVSLTLDTSGEYLVRANTLFKNKTGRYTLLVAEAGGPVMVEAPADGGAGSPLVSATPGARMPLVLGQELRGARGDLQPLGARDALLGVEAVARIGLPVAVAVALDLRALGTAPELSQRRQRVRMACATSTGLKMSLAVSDMAWAALPADPVRTC